MELAEGRGRAGGCGYSERRRRSLSGACERKNRGGDGDEGVSGRVPGVEAAPRRRREALWWPQAKQTSRVVAWRARARAPCPSGEGGRRQGENGGGLGRAGPVGGAR